MARFQKGNKFGRGRPKGSPNKTTVVGRSMLERLEIGEDDLPPAIDRWKELLTDKDPSIRLAAEKFVFVALHGIPRPVAIPQPTNGPIVIKWEGDLADSGREEFVGRLRLPIE